MAENYILTDDFYGDLISNGVPMPMTCVADHPVGRLVERPSEMLALVEAFLARDGTIPADPALVVGHSLVVDTANVERATLQGDGIATDALIGDSWTATQFRSALLETPHNLSAINTHARHNAYAAPSGIGLRAWDMLTATHPTSGSVAFSLGCHAGLNVPPDYGPTEAVDFPEAFAGRGVGYISNTGWGIGSRSSVAYSEDLATQLTAQLTQDESTTLGEALVTSKMAYIANKGFLDGIDEKVLLQFALYGLPMYRLSSGDGLALASSRLESAPPLLDRAEAHGPGLTKVTVWYQPAENSFEQHSSSDGVYYTLDNQYQVGHNSPLEPRHFARPEVSGGVIHGAVFRGGIYSDVSNFDPVVAAASIITGGVHSEGVITAANWYPPIPFQVVNVHPSLENRLESFVVQFGQYRPADDTLRLFSRMSFDLHYSVSEDFAPPTVVISDSVYGEWLQVGVVTTDTSDIHSASVIYSANDGHWRSIGMTRKKGTDMWYALLPMSGVEYLVQVVDGAGNVTIDDNDGLYYQVDALITGLDAVNDSPTGLGSVTTFTATISTGSNVTYTNCLTGHRVLQDSYRPSGDCAASNGNLHYTWRFGDNGATGNGAVVTHTYPHVGTYTATVTVSNSVSMLTATTAVTITIDEPIAGLEATNNGPVALGSVTTLTATISAGSNVSYTWDFGDGGLTGTLKHEAIGYGAVVTYTYPSVGIYTAVVTASNRVNALSATTTVTVDDLKLYLPLILKH